MISCNQLKELSCGIWVGHLGDGSEARAAPGAWRGFGSRFLNPQSSGRPARSTPPKREVKSTKGRTGYSPTPPVTNPRVPSGAKQVSARGDGAAGATAWRRAAARQGRRRRLPSSTATGTTRSAEIPTNLLVHLHAAENSEPQISDRAAEKRRADALVACSPHGSSWR